MTTSIFDGRSIDLHGLRFNGSADVTQEQGADLHQNQTVTVLLTGVVKRTQFVTDANDRLKRTNVVTVTNAVPLTPEQFEQVQVALAMGDADLSVLFKDGSEDDGGEAANAPAKESTDDDLFDRIFPDDLFDDDHGGDC